MAVKFPRASATSHTQALTALLKVDGRGQGQRKEGGRREEAHTRGGWVWGGRRAEGTGDSHHLLNSQIRLNSSNMGWQVRAGSLLLLRVPGLQEEGWVHAEPLDPA